MNIGIVGAGVTGLTAGFLLSRRGHRVTVFEREPEIGGLVQTVRVGGEPLEKTYHHLFTSDTDFIALVDELGLSDRLQWLTPRNAVYAGGRIYPFTSPKDLLCFRELSIFDRLRLGRLTLRARKVDDWRTLDGQTARRWVIQNAGTGVWEKFWRPLMAAKFDRDADEVSAVWLWNKIKLRGSSRGKNPSRETLGYLDGSFGLVTQTLAQRINEAGGKIHPGAPVRQIRRRSDGKYDVIPSDKDGGTFDAVIATTAPQTFLELTPDLPASMREKLARVRYKANVCVLLELTGPLSPYYWISIAQPDWPFVAVIEHTNLLPAQRYGGTIVYLSRYIDERDRLYQADDAAVCDLFLKHLQIMFPAFHRGGVANARVYRSRFAQPVIVTGYSQLIADWKMPAPLDNLYLASMAQIFPEDRGQNYAVRTARQVVEMIDGRR